MSRLIHTSLRWGMLVLVAKAFVSCCFDCNCEKGELPPSGSYDVVSLDVDDDSLELEVQGVEIRGKRLLLDYSVDGVGYVGRFEMVAY